MAKIFVSYARDDLEIAKRVSRDLSRQGHEIWIDIEQLIPGQDWRQEIEKAIRESDCFLALLSQRSLNKRGFIQKELREALRVLEEVPDGVIYLIPARVEDCLPSNNRLAKLHWVDLFPSYEKGIEKVVQSLSKLRVAEPGEQTLAGGVVKPISLPWYLERFVDDSTLKIALKNLPLVVGRGRRCDFRLDSALVSGRHAEFFLIGEKLCLRDLGSTNGTFVNGEPIGQYDGVDDRDVVHFADQEFRIVLGRNSPSSYQDAGKTSTARASLEEVRQRIQKSLFKG